MKNKCLLALLCAFLTINSEHLPECSDISGMSKRATLPNAQEIVLTMHVTINAQPQTAQHDDTDPEFLESDLSTDSIDDE
jgi:hypothetical protein